jgi:hypothetical protein
MLLSTGTLHEERRHGRARLPSTAVDVSGRPALIEELYPTAGPGPLARAQPGGAVAGAPCAAAGDDRRRPAGGGCSRVLACVGPRGGAGLDAGSSCGGVRALCNAALGGRGRAEHGAGGGALLQQFNTVYFLGYSLSELSTPKLSMHNPCFQKGLQVNCGIVAWPSCDVPGLLGTFSLQSERKFDSE